VLELYLTMTLLLLFTKMAWDKGQSIQPQYLIEYMQESPNAYRLFDQFLLKLHRKRFSFITWTSIAWFGSLVLTYIILFNPVWFTNWPFATLVVWNPQRMVFLIGAAACSMNFYIRQSLLYPLLALFSVTLNPLLLLPIVVVKEQGLWLAGGYLMFIGHLDLLNMTYIGLAGVFYLLVRWSIGKKPRSVENAPFFTPRYAINHLRNKRPKQVLIDLVALAAMFVFVVMEGMLGIQMIIWTAGLVFLFALWWEPQLWFPTVILILGGA
jgi:hypothetical protein